MVYSWDSGVCSVSDLEHWSEDLRFGLCVGDASVKLMLEECVRARSRETGGILIGHYSDGHDCAIVDRITSPSIDSKFGSTWFYRGVNGLQRMLDHYWRQGEGFYLGEWHFHPSAAPTPSPKDHNSMRRIAGSYLYNCPEPVLFIIGGDPHGRWSTSATVFPRGKTPAVLAAATHAGKKVEERISP